MAAPSSIIRQFQESLGVDLTSSDLARSNRHLSGGKNFEFTESGALTKRRGQHVMTSIDMTGGIWEFKTTGLDGVSKTELLGARETLYKLVEVDLTINNVGASAAVLSTAFDASLGWYFRIHVGGVSVLNYNTGFGTTSDPTLYDLQQTIDALADFTASIPTRFQPKNVPAADVSTTSEEFTLAAHGLENGQMMRVTSSGSVPAGLVSGEIYRVVRRQDGTFRLSDSTRSLFTTANLTSQGTGTHTLVSVDIRAAYLQRLDDVSLAAGGSTTLKFYMWEPLKGLLTGSTSSAAGFAQNFANFGSATWQKISAAQCRGIIYFSADASNLTLSQTGASSTSSTVLKYDGQTLMKAGLYPFGANSFAMAAAATGSPISDVRGNSRTYADRTGSYYYGATIVQVDKTGQIHESAITFDVGQRVVTAGNCPVINTVQNIGVATGLNVRKVARVNGDQTGVLTITVASSNTLQVGDVAFFWDNNQGRFIARVITARTDTSITISSTSLDTDTSSFTLDSGGNVNVEDGAYISNNFRLRLYRTKTGGAATGPYYHVDDIPAITISGLTEYYADQRADSALGAEYLAPVYPPAPPPPGSFVAADGDNLLVSGFKYAPETVFFSDIDDQESFPEATHNFQVNGTVTGINYSGDAIVVGQEFALDVVTGSLPEFQFRVDRLASNIGVTCHESMVVYNEGILNFLTHRGPYMLVNGRDLQPLGGVRSGNELVSPLEKYFQGGTSLVTSSQAQAFKRAVGAVANIDRYYLLFVPHETGTTYSTDGTQSQLFVFDYAQGAWMIWDNCYAGAGIASYEGDLYLSGRTTRTLVKFQPGTSEKDYVDFNGAITMRVETHDETLGQPGVFKKFLRLGIYILESLAMSTVNYVVKTYLDWDTSTARTSSTRVVTTQKTEQVKLKGQKARSLRVVFENAELEQAPVITGYEIEAARPYRTTLKD